MKANIPSRIALKVASALESRIILDEGGAEKLVGNGDMLFKSVGSSKPVRLQGTWVSDDERERIIDFIKDNGTVDYAEDVIAQIEKAAAEKSSGSSNAAEIENDRDDDSDPLLPQAVEVVIEMGQASVSMLQRRLKLGYSRAARLVDQMEERGIVGKFEGAKPRAVLITKQQWQEMQYVNGTAPAPDSQLFDSYSDAEQEIEDDAPIDADE
ncbi:MAG: DNA translocase FtsK, partial [Oscillospiraceae bacterium]|nr:DNA translocase FtsK [Oscillospiraceae bacterium]